MLKNKKMILLLVPLIVVLSGCTSSSPLDTNPVGIWDTVVYWFAVGMVWLSDIFGNNIAYGIIISAIILRAVQIPLYSKQLKSSESMENAKPEMDALNKKYANKSSKEDQAKKSQEMMAIYKKHNVNPLSSCLPLLITMPILFLYYGALRGLLVNGTTVPFDGLITVSQTLGTDEITQVWLGLDLSTPSLLLAVFAAITTYFSFTLSTLGRKQEGQAEKMMTMMKYFFPIMILFSGLSLPGSLALYWGTSNVFTIFQTLYFRRTHITNHMIMKKEEKKNNKKA